MVKLALLCHFAEVAEPIKTRLTALFHVTYEVMRMS